MSAIFRISALFAASLLVAPKPAVAADTNTPSSPPQRQSQKPADAKSKRKPTEERRQEVGATIHRRLQGRARDDLPGQRLRRRHRQAALARPGRSSRCRQPDRLLEPQARPLRRRQALVREGAGRQSGPHPHLVLLRHVARRAGQSAQGARSPDQGGVDLRQHRVPRIRRCSRKSSKARAPTDRRERTSKTGAGEPVSPAVIWGGSPWPVAPLSRLQSSSPA